MVNQCNSPLFGTGEVYHCHELDCPVHGERNKIMAGAEQRVWQIVTVEWSDWGDEVDVVQEVSAKTIDEVIRLAKNQGLLGCYVRLKDSTNQLTPVFI